MKAKQKINFYAYLYSGITLMCGHFSLGKYRKLKKDLKQFQLQSAGKFEQFPITSLYPCYGDLEDNAGSLHFHYFFQDLYVAKRININAPRRHADIGSRIDGFVAHVASFREIEVFDIRPLQEEIPNVIFHQLDLMNVDNLEIEKVDSISCLHALEHFGLGRYGDPICFEGYLVGFKNITKLLEPGGKFYFSVPLGEQRIEFHAHRVFSLACLVRLVSDDFDIDSFSYIDDENTLHPETEITDELLKTNCGCHFGCAIFELIKKG